MHDLRSPLLAMSNVKDALAALPTGTSMADLAVQQMLDVLSHCVPLTQHIINDMCVATPVRSCAHAKFSASACAALRKAEECR